LDAIIDMNHSRTKLARTIDWSFIEERFGAVNERIRRRRVTKRQGSPRHSEAAHDSDAGDIGDPEPAHAPEVECIGKGKAHRPYEFWVKVFSQPRWRTPRAVSSSPCEDAARQPL
jgi:hypothetical protein